MCYLITPEYISITGSVVAFIGTVILTLSLGGIFWELKFALTALSTTLESFISGRDIFVFTGLEERIKKALKKVKIPTYIGLFLIIASIIIQSFSLYISHVNTEKYAYKTKQANFLSELNNDKIIKLHSTIDTNINSLNLLKKQIDKLEEEIINLRRLEQKMHNE